LKNPIQKSTGKIQIALISLRCIEIKGFSSALLMMELKVVKVG